MNGVDDCFTHDTADTPELPYFDATLAAVEASACVDTSRIFVMGFSSGSWLTSYLGCARGNLIRAQGSIAGGLPPLPPTCTGPIPAIYVSDINDNKNPPEIVMPALQRVLTANGCGADTEPYDVGVPSPCVQYKGCMPGLPRRVVRDLGLGPRGSVDDDDLDGRFLALLDVAALRGALSACRHRAPRTSSRVAHRPRAVRAANAT